MLLLAGAGSVMQGFSAADTHATGLRPDNVMSVGIPLARTHTRHGLRARIILSTSTKVAETPAVTTAAFQQRYPATEWMEFAVWILGKPGMEQQMASIIW